MKRHTLNPKYTVAGLIKLKKNVRSEPERRRFQDLELIASGIKRKVVVETLKLSRNILGQWSAKVNQLGPEALRTASGQGRRGKLTDTQLSALVQEIMNNPCRLGFRKSNWDGKIISRRIASKFGVHYFMSGIYRLLRRIGLTKQRPTRLYGECSQQIKDDFRKSEN